MLSIDSKAKKLAKFNIDNKVLNYLNNRFNNLDIEVLNRYQGNLLNLMKEGHLEGWCWETTETAILFLEDNDYIERGYLTFGDLHSKYYHSWICFNYNGIDYVLDPCLNILTKKSYYERIFNTEIIAEINAKAVKETFIDGVINYIPKDYSNSYMPDFFKELCKAKRDEVHIKSENSIYESFYRNGSGYRAELENKKIKKLKVHYYYLD